MKKAFYRRIVEGLNVKLGIRKQDVWITLADNARGDWSFGGGEMQYAPDINRKHALCFQSRRLIKRNETFEECKMLTFQIWRPVMSGA